MFIKEKLSKICLIAVVFVLSLCKAWAEDCCVTLADGTTMRGLRYFVPVMDVNGRNIGTPQAVFQPAGINQRVPDFMVRTPEGMMHMGFYINAQPSQNYAQPQHSLVTSYLSANHEQYPQQTPASTSILPAPYPLPQHALQQAADKAAVLSSAASSPVTNIEPTPPRDAFSDSDDDSRSVSSTDLAKLMSQRERENRHKQFQPQQPVSTKDRQALEPNSTAGATTTNGWTSSSAAKTRRMAHNPYNREIPKVYY